MIPRTPLSKEKDETFISRVLFLLKDSSLSEWKQNSQVSYNFVHGQQWDREDVKSHEDSKRPFVTFNRTAVNVNAVVGLVINNPQDILPIPIDLGDVEIDETLEGAIRYIRKLTNAEEQESEAVFDLLVSGVGAIHINVDYSNIEPRIVVERVDPLEMLWDTGNKGTRNMSKARWVARVKEVDPDDLEFLIPGITKKLGGLEGLEDSGYPTSDLLSDMLSQSNMTHVPRGHDYGDNTQNKDLSRAPGVRVIEFEWFEYDTVYKILDPINNTISLVSEDRYDKIKDEFNLDSYKKISLKKKVFRKAIIVNNQYVEREVAPSQVGFSYLFCTGYYNPQLRMWYGIVEFQKDPQKWANKFFSLIIDIIARNAKGGAFIEKDALENPREAEYRWGQPSPLIMLKRGGVNKIRDRSPGVYPAGVERMMEMSMSAITDSIGINPEFLGQADRRQAGILEQTRKQSTYGIIAKYFESLKLMRRMEGLTIIEYIKEYFSPQQLIRIDIENAQRFETVSSLFSDPSVTYDIVVDEAPTSMGVKERVWTSIVPILPILLKMGVPIPPSILDYAPLPLSLVTEWKGLLARVQGANPQLKGDQEAPGLQGGAENNPVNIDQGNNVELVPGLLG